MANPVELGPPLPSFWDKLEVVPHLGAAVWKGGNERVEAEGISKSQTIIGTVVGCCGATSRLRSAQFEGYRYKLI